MKKIFHKHSWILYVLAFLILGSSLVVLLNIDASVSEKEIDKYESQIMLQTPYNDNQGYHPKVISFPKKWHGYKYWMAYTPYPLADASKENPVINVSNDRINWIEPEGIENPLYVPTEKSNKIYNSDTHLLYNRDDDTLELFWRFVDDEHNKVIIYRMISKDGVHWDDKEIFLESKNRKKLDYVSPAIDYRDHKYRIWYVDKRAVYYFEKDDDEVTKPRRIDIKFEKKMYPWHIDVIYNKTKKLYEMVLCAYDKIYDRSDMSLYYTSSSDNQKWDEAFLILSPTNDSEQWDSNGLYRASLLYENETYYLFYSGHDAQYNVGIGLATSKNIKELKRINRHL